MTLVAALAVALSTPAQAPLDVSMLGAGQPATLAELTVGDLLTGDFGCTPCTSYVMIDITFHETANWFNVILDVPGQSVTPNTDGHNYNLKFGLPSSQDVGWCNPNQPADECTPMSPCAASFWGVFNGLGNGYGLKDMTAPGTPWTVAPQGAETYVDCGAQAGFGLYELWWTDPENILNKKRIATVVVAYGCNSCTKVYPPQE